MPRFILPQTSFNGGELSDEVLGRTDLAQYSSGLTRCENFIVHTEGGLHRRPGSRFSTDTLDGNVRSRLIPFVFANDQAYMLEFSHKKIRVMAYGAAYNGAPFKTGPVEVSSNTFLSADRDTTTNELKTVLPHGYTHLQGEVYTPVSDATFDPTDDYWVVLPQPASGAQSSIDVDNNTLTSSAAFTWVDNMGPFRLTTDGQFPGGLSPFTDYYVRDISSNTFRISLTAGGTRDAISGTGSGTWTLTPTNDYLRTKLRLSADSSGSPILSIGAGVGGVLTERFDSGDPSSSATPVYMEIATTFEESHLADIHFAQSADILFIAHPSFRPHQLARTHVGEVLWDVLPEPSSGNDVNTTSNELRSTGGAFPGIVKYAENDGPFRMTATGASETFPGGLNGLTDYYVRDITHFGVVFSTFSISLTAGGSVINISSSEPWELTPRNDLLVGTPRFALDEMGLVDGPYLDENTNPDANITNTSGTIRTVTTLTLNAEAKTEVNGGSGWIASKDIGRIVRMDNVDVTPGDQGWGFAEIYSVTSDTVAHGFVFQAFGGTPGATSRWRLGAWTAESVFGSNGMPIRGYPSTVSLHEQRLVFAGESGQPHVLTASNTGLYNVFRPTDIDGNVVDTNTYRFGIASNRVNAIQWLSLGRQLYAGTKDSVFSVRSSNEEQSITPTNVTVPKITSVGTTSVQPANINDRVVYITRNNQGVRSIISWNQVDAPPPQDLTLLSKHILGRTLTIDEISFQFDRQEVLWLVRSDGVLLGVTYLPEQEVFAWHRHVLGGVFGEAAITVSDYANIEVGTTLEVIKSDGTSVTFTSEASGGTAPSSDLGFRPNASNDTTADNIYTAVNAHSDFTVANPAENTVVIKETSRSGTLPIRIVSSDTTRLMTLDEGHAVVESVATIPSEDGSHDQVWLVVKRTVNGLTVRHIEYFADEWLDSEPTSQRYVDSHVEFSGTATASFTGFTHLEGATLQVLADGSVVPEEVVSSGTITTDRTHARVVAGLGYRSEAESVPLDIPMQGPPGASTGLAGRVEHFVFRLWQSHGGEVGAVDHDGQVAFYDPILLRSADDLMDNPVPAFTGDIKVPVSGPYIREKRFVVRQMKPLAFNVLSVTAHGSSGQR